MDSIIKIKKRNEEDIWLFEFLAKNNAKLEWNEKNRFIVIRIGDLFEAVPNVRSMILTAANNLKRTLSKLKVENEI